MAIAFIANGGYNNGTATVVLTKPTGTLQNHCMLMWVNVQQSASAGTVTTPAGWTYVTDTVGCADGSGFWDRVYLFYKIAGASEPSTYTVTLTAQFGGDGDIRTYSGTDLTNPINSFQVKAQVTNTTTIIVPAFSETFKSGEWFVGCSCNDNNTLPVSSSPALSNVYTNAGVNVSFYLGDYAPSGVPGAETFDYGGSGNTQGGQAVGVTIVTPQAAAGSPLISGGAPRMAGWFYS